MKACGRTLKSTMKKCGAIFEGPGAYCRECRNDYQREYYAKRKDPNYKAGTEKTGSSCQACAIALKSNTMGIIDAEGLTQSVVLCETCKAVVTYLSEKIEEEAQEFLIELSVTLSSLRYEKEDSDRIVNAINGTSSRRTTTPDVYVPQLTTPGNREACGACDDLAEPGSDYCKRHAHWAEIEDALVTGKDLIDGA